MKRMKKDEGPVIDMTPEGEFVDSPQPKPDIGMFVVRLAIFGLVLGTVALMFWMAVLVIPLLLLGGLGIMLLRALFAGGGAPRRF